MQLSPKLVEKIPKKVHAKSLYRSRAYNDQSAFLRLERTIGNRAIGQLIQAKLRIGAPNDKYEQEADRVAEQVMSTTADSRQKAVGSNGNTIQTQEGKKLIQPKPFVSEITPLVQRQDNELEEEEGENESVPTEGANETEPTASEEEQEEEPEEEGSA